MAVDADSPVELIKLLVVLASALLVIMGQVVARKFKGKEGEEEAADDELPEAEEPHGQVPPKQARIPAPKRHQGPTPKELERFQGKPPRRHAPTPKRSRGPRYARPRTEPVISLREVFLWVGFLILGISLVLWILQ
jgi:hypothetical protein